MIFLISLNLSQFDWSSRGQILVRACQMILDVEFGCNEMKNGGWRMFWVCLTVDRVCQSYLNMDNFWILALKPSNWYIQHHRNLFISSDYQIFQIKKWTFWNFKCWIEIYRVWKKYVIYGDYQIISLQSLLELTNIYTYIYIYIYNMTLRSIQL